MNTTTHKKTIQKTAEILSLALIYFLSAKIGQFISVPPGNVTPLWIPSGIILAAVLLRGYWIWPGIWLGAFAGNVSAYIDFQSYESILSSLFSGSMNGFGDVAGTLIGAYLIRKYTQCKNPLHQSSHIFIFLMYGVVLSAATSAVFGVTSLAIAGFIPWSDYTLTWLVWCIGDAVGVLIFTPLILSIFGSNRSQLKRNRKVELTVYAMALMFAVMICLQLFDLELSEQLPLFLVTPILIWSVLRLSEEVTFTSIVILSLASVFATAAGVGPFAITNNVNSLLELQIFIAIMSITMLILNAVVRERAAINSQLEETHRDLEKLVEKRTRHLRDAISREQSLNEGLEQTTQELNLTQKQLIHAQKMESLGTLAGGIAHDFNNILNVIIGNAELAQSKLSADQPAYRYLDTISRSSSRAAELVKQILAFSRMETENYRHINLPEVVDEAIKMVRSTIPSNIKIDYVAHNNDISIFGDSTQIHQIIINLCTNAYHSIDKDDGHINIRLEQTRDCPEDIVASDNGCVLITVSDNGSGIPETILERIFDPFFTTKETGKGTGLGLSVVHTIIESHKGIIKVSSQVGAGSTFDIYLPISTDTAEDSHNIQANTHPEPADKYNKQPVIINCVHNIMLIDDEEDILRLYEQYLEAQGYNVISFTNPTQALEEFEEKSECIELVITDQSMPELTGKELCKLLLNIKPAIKIILTTGYSDIINEQTAISAGISQYLDKPVKLADLNSAIQACLDTVE